MTTTPTLWRDTFYPNYETPGGAQRRPQTVALSDGRILTVWQDDTNGPSPGIDIMARFSNAVGTVIGTGAFQLNSSFVSSDEDAPKIVALPDGGYVLASGGYFGGGTGAVIGIERFNAAGVKTGSNVITDPNNHLDNWEITANSAGDYTVVFERDNDIHSVTYDHATDAAGPVRNNLAQNAGDADNLGAIATLANGHIVTIYNEPDFALNGTALVGVEFAIVDPLTGQQTRAPQQLTGGSTFFYDGYYANSVIVLTGGQIVLSYYSRDPDDGNTLRICAGEAPGSAVSGGIKLADSGSQDSELVALKDGGFFAAWISTSTFKLVGQRFDAAGATIGDQLTITQNGSLGGHMTLTGDGRILVPLVLGSGDIGELILDPRDNVIYGSANADVLTTQIDSSYVYGEGGSDTIYGRTGNDVLHGGEGRDILNGGYGNDFLYGESGKDALAGSYGDDIYFIDDYLNGRFDQVDVQDTVTELAGQGRDTVVIATLDALLSASRRYTLGANIEDGTVTGYLTDFNITGNELDNALRGHGGANTLSGLNGNDRLEGNSGADVLIGGIGNDTYVLQDITLDAGNTAVFDAVIEDADGGTDLILISAVGAANSYTLGANIENGVVLGTAGFTLAGNALANALTGSSGADRLAGAVGNDRLDGKSGVDVLGGGQGNDVYYVDAAGEAVEQLNAGIDTVISSVSYALGANIERLSLTSTAVSGTGNALDNTITGNAYANNLAGGAGNDSLAGKGGSDAFIFNTALAANNVDTIVDFANGIDVIRLKGAVFTGLAAAALSSDAFNVGASAQDASDRIIYNSVSGELFFDADGQGGAAQVQFAVLNTGLALTNESFFVF